MMNDFHKPIASGFAASIMVVCILAMSAPAFAKGGGGSRGSSGRPPPPVFLEGSGAGRAMGSGCSISRKPVTNASGNIIGYRRVQICNLD
jgi:hypothetical protein